MRWLSFIFFTFVIPVAFSKLVWENALVQQIFKSKPNTSMVVASLPLRFTLAKLASVAQGVAKNQLYRSLELDSIERAKNFYSSLRSNLIEMQRRDLIMLNKLFVNYSIEVNTSFLTNSSRLFGVDVESVGFNMPWGALSHINNGIATATYKRIKDVLEIKDITAQTKMMMITAIHYKPRFQIPFQLDRTEYRSFHHNSGKISQIPMMIMEEHYKFYEDRNFQMLTTYLTGATLTVIVPVSLKGLPGLLSELEMNPRLILNAQKAMNRTLKKLVLPRIKIKSFLDLTDILKTSPVHEILNSSTTGLNGILKEDFRNKSNMFISKVKQKLFLDMDEFGVFRKIDENYRPNPMMMNVIPEFLVDKPFYFTIDVYEFIETREQLLEIPHPLFHGVYYGPE